MFFNEKKLESVFYIYKWMISASETSQSLWGVSK